MYKRQLLEHENLTVGQVTNWVLFLNQYFWLQNFVDQAVGVVLDALANSAFVDNTIVIFLSDHGEYAGSHGLHTKGWGAYDEGIRVPLSVQFPKQTGSIAMGQMLSLIHISRTTAPHEIRGPSIRGGDKLALAAGDVVHIPIKTAHQMLLESGKQITYFVVKIDAR